MIKMNDIPLGVRVSNKLKRSLDNYCQENGISRKHFVEEAIRERLVEIMEEEQDVYIAKERFKKQEIVSEQEVEAYFARRLKKK